MTLIREQGKQDVIMTDRENLDKRKHKRSARADAIPNFFIVGAPKCATTAMDSYLAAHPEIFMAEAKESHYFADDLYPPNIGCPRERYFGFFDSVTNEKVIGESSVFYMLSKTAAKRIHTHQPDAKILFMLRDPIDVIVSHHSQIVFEGIETEKDFSKALALEDKRRAEHDKGPITYRERVLHYHDIVRFSEQIERFMAVFPPEQLHFIFYDDIKKDLPGTYASVLKFLGVDDSFQPEFTIKNANKELRSKRFGAFLRETPNWVTALSRILLPTEELRYKARMKLKRLNTSFKPRPPLPAAVRYKLAQDLKPEVSRLSALLDRDMSHWCASEKL